LAALKDVTFAFERCESRLCEMFTPDYHLVSTPPSPPPPPPSLSFSLFPPISCYGSLCLSLCRKFVSLFIYLGVSVSQCNVHSRLPSRLSLPLSLSLVTLCSRVRDISRLLFSPLSFAPFLFIVLSFTRCPSCSFPLFRAPFQLLARTRCLACPFTLLSLALSLFPRRTSRFYK
jgi:hypothetical protein